MTYQLASELAPLVRVNAVAPGVVKTRLSGLALAGHGGSGGRRAPAGPPRRAGRHRPGHRLPRFGGLVVDDRAWCCRSMGECSGLPARRSRDRCIPLPIPTWPWPISTARSTPSRFSPTPAGSATKAKGRVVTYSRKVFIPLTTLCRDRCTYCTFAQPPGGGGMYLEPEEVLAIAQGRGGAELHRGAVHSWRSPGGSVGPGPRQFLHAHGEASTLGYVESMSPDGARRDRCVPARQPGPPERSGDGCASAVQPLDGSDARKRLPALDGAGHAPPQLSRQGPAAATGDDSNRRSAAGSVHDRHPGRDRGEQSGDRRLDLSPWRPSSRRSGASRK